MYFVSALVSVFHPNSSCAHCESGFSDRWECGLLLKGHKLAAEAAAAVVATTALSIIVNLKIGAATAAKGANLVPMASEVSKIHQCWMSSKVKIIFPMALHFRIFDLWCWRSDSGGSWGTTTLASTLLLFFVTLLDQVLCCTTTLPATMVGVA